MSVRKASVATARELTGEAQWKIIQKNTFTRWTNEHLKKVTKHVEDLETDLSDGVRLIALVEVLSGKRFPKVNNSPNSRMLKLDNVTKALTFLEDDEGIKIVNIDSSDIVDHKLKLILGLIWTLIQHYSISKSTWKDDEGGQQKQEQTPKQRLLGWIQGKLPVRLVRNFTTDWNDGKAIGALVDGVVPGLCPDWMSWNPQNNVENATEAMNAAEQWLDVPQLIQPAEMCNPNVDEQSVMTYLSQFPNAKLTLRALHRPRTNTSPVRTFGPEVEQLKKELDATKLNLQEANRKTEHLDDLQKIMHSTTAELKESRRENEAIKEENKSLKQEVEQLKKELDATKLKLQKGTEHSDELQKILNSKETELNFTKREKEILIKESSILTQELDATKRKLQEANRRAEHLDDLKKTMDSTETELVDAKREIEILKEENKILKHELEPKTKLECLSSVIYECTTEVAVNEDFVPDTPSRPFDDSSMFLEGERFFIVGMKLHTRMWGPQKVIGAMEVIFNTGQSVVHGSRNIETFVNDEEFRIGQDEYITEINVRSGWMLDRLTFTTNKGIVYGPYGCEGGGHRRFVNPCEGAYLAYITGTVDDTWGATAVRTLRFFWGVPKSA